MTKKSKIKYKKAPQAPRRFKSAYMFFSTSKHKEIREELGKKGVAEKTTNIAKLVSQAWKELSPEDRNTWDEKARKDKLRYEVEKSMYTGPWKVPAKKLSQKDPTAPKRPMSAFLAFSHSKRASVKCDNATMNNAEISRVLAQMWKDASPEDKKEYIDREYQLRQKYLSEIAVWREKTEKELAEQRKQREDIALQTVAARGDQPLLMGEEHHAHHNGHHSTYHPNDLNNSTNPKGGGAGGGGGAAADADYYSSPYYNYAARTAGAADPYYMHAAQQQAAAAAADNPNKQQQYAPPNTITPPSVAEYFGEYGDAAAAAAAYGGYPPQYGGYYYPPPPHMPPPDQSAAAGGARGDYQYPPPNYGGGAYGDYTQGYRQQHPHYPPQQGGDPSQSVEEQYRRGDYAPPYETEGVNKQETVETSASYAQA